MELSIIIINYNSLEYLKKCLLCLKVSDFQKPYEIIIVDNASYDGSYLLTMGCDKNIKFIQSKKNLGFAKANNLGFWQSTGKFLLFLNPDTEVQSHTLTVLYNKLKENKDVGAIGCKLLNTDRSIQLSCIKSMPNICNQIFDFQILRDIFPFCRFWGTGVLASKNYFTGPVDVVSGACIMVPRDVFLKIGLFNNEYFMYSEDVELCYRIHKLGKKVIYTNEAAIIHHGGGSIPKDKARFDSEIAWMDSRYKYFINVRGKKYAKIYRISIGLTAIFRLYVLSLSLFTKSIFLKNKHNIKYSINKWIRLLHWSFCF